jgi:hypothetical protein
MNIATSPRETCGFCGEPWFGSVAYCPYCGCASGGATVATAADPAPESDFMFGTDFTAEAGLAPRADLATTGDDAPDIDFDALARAADGGPARAHDPHEHAPPEPSRARRGGWKPVALATVLGSVVLAAIVLGVGQRAATSDDRAGPQGTVRVLGGDAAQGSPTQTDAAVAAPAAAAAPAQAAPAPDAPPPAPAPAAPAAPRAEAEAPAQQPAAPAPRRSLCSVANEAAGLCRPQ